MARAHSNALAKFARRVAAGPRQDLAAAARSWGQWEAALVLLKTQTLSRRVRTRFQQYRPGSMLTTAVTRASRGVWLGSLLALQ
jgi:hypothetical protein